MKKVIISFTVILVLTSAAEANYVVFDNGEPILSGGNDIRARLQADDFVLTQDISLTGAHFWTFEEDHQIWDGTLEYFIFTDNGGMPGTVISFGDGQGIQKNVTGEVTTIATEYEYSFGFETPISLVANDTYWFGLHMASGYPSDSGFWFSWSTSASGFGSTSFESEGGTLDNWVDTGIHRAFYLEGVPEPATLILLALGSFCLQELRNKNLEKNRKL